MSGLTIRVAVAPIRASNSRRRGEEEARTSVGERSVTRRHAEIRTGQDVRKDQDRHGRA
jgi:hypothetical protein